MSAERRYHPLNPALGDRQCTAPPHADSAPTVGAAAELLARLVPNADAKHCRKYGRSSGGLTA
jgi:hypothetical protein